MLAPPRSVPADDRGYLAVLTKAVFQSGMSLAVIEKKWPGFEKAFAGFDIPRVAGFGPDDVDRLLGDADIVRNGRKIEATIANARALDAIVEAHGSVAAWLDQSAGLPWRERKAAVSAPFKFIGPMAAYFFLYCVGQNVPPHDQEAEWTDPVPPGYPETG